MEKKMGKKKKKTLSKRKKSFVARNLEFDVNASRSQMENFVRKIAKSQKKAIITVKCKKEGRQR